MRRLAIALFFALAAGGPAVAQTQDELLQRLFSEAALELQAGNLDEAARIFRDMLKTTKSPRVKLELARTLFMKGEYKEAKALFEEVSTRSDTPWRVRDNILHFVRMIEDRTGYLKFGFSMVSDSNPKNVAARSEMSVGGFRVTPTDAPEKVTGMRYSVRGWKPLDDSFRNGVYLNASYTDFAGGNLDRITADGGVLRDLSGTGRVRGKVGMEIGTFGGKLLYRFPYVGLDAVVKETETWRVAGELKAGRVDVAQVDYLDANYLSVSASVRKNVSENAVVSMSGTLERSRANEHPYSYTGWDIGPAVDMFWPETTFVTGARISFGSRRYEDTDPFFGERRSDSRYKLDASITNKRWRVGNGAVSLVASFERNHSTIEYYSFRKFNVSLVIE